jgi:hypothetical protein
MAIYAIIPVGKPFDPNAINTKETKLGSTMRPDAIGLREYGRLSVVNKESELSFRVATYINNAISDTSPDLMGALMVPWRAGEFGHGGPDFRARAGGDATSGKRSVAENTGQPI